MNKTIIAAILITIAWLVFWSCFVYLTWNTSKSMPLNEWGDFLAGAFSPLAFMWLVLGYFQQGRELSQNTEMLRLQAAELRNSVEQQTQLVQTTREDVELNKAQLEDSRRKEKNKAQPLFRFNPQTFANFSKGYTDIFIDLTNFGSSISRLKISQNDAEFNIDNDYFSHWDNGKNVFFFLRANREITRPKGHITKIYFDFIDGNKEASSKTIYLKWDINYKIIITDNMADI